MADKRTPIPVRRAIEDIAADIATWRKLRGLTQAQLADRAGVSQTTLRRLEHGDGGVALENVLRILRGLGVMEQLSAARPRTPHPAHG